MIGEWGLLIFEVVGWVVNGMMDDGAQSSACSIPSGLANGVIRRHRVSLRSTLYWNI